MIILVASLTATISLVALTSWIVDPNEYFRAGVLGKPLYSLNQRLQAPANIRTRTFDTIIVGSSTANGLRPSYLGTLKAVNASLKGGTLADSARLIDYSLKKRSIQRVIWGIDTFLFSNETSGDKFPRSVQKLLDGNPLWLPEYLLSTNTILDSARVIADRLGLLTTPQRELDKLTDYADTAPFSRKALLKAIPTAQPPLPPKAEWLRLISSTSPNARLVNNTIVRVARENPTVRFIYYFTPVSIFSHLANRRDVQASEMATKRYTLKQLAALPNTTIIDLQCDDSITFSTTVYADLVHYNPTVNKSIAEEIVAPTPRVCTDEILYNHMIESIGLLERLTH